MTAKTFVLAAVLCALLAACAGAPQHKLLPNEDLDEQKVVLVNQWAETHGARLIWINYPTRYHPEPSY
ncbi:MAG TPA: hypothetical protein VHW73_00330 [Rudaea sp.]|jgi:hypothetical protein|nr:hypothetical protein [Rudaea sp.]